MTHEHHAMHPCGSHTAHSKNKTEHHYPHGGHDHHAMIQDFRKRFWISLFFTLPVLILSPIITHFLHLETLTFQGDSYVLFILSSIIFFYGGWPFLKGLSDELSNRKPGMMTLIAIAISVAYLYSSLVVFGLSGMMFFWELATLIDIMLLGHWIEMKAILGAGEALEKLATLMPSMAHKIMPDGKVEDIPLSDLAIGDQVIIKPGEKIPADGIVVEGETSINESMLTGESKPVTKKIARIFF